jgi:hypothetical protein
VDTRNTWDISERKSLNCSPLCSPDRLNGRGTEESWEVEASAGQLVKWRRERDSNPRYGFPYSGFQDRLFKPLTHPSAPNKDAARSAVSESTLLLARSLGFRLSATLLLPAHSVAKPFHRVYHT